MGVTIDYRRFIRDRKWYKFKYIVYEDKLKRPQPREVINDEWGYFTPHSVHIAPWIGETPKNWIHWTLRILNKCV